MRGEFFSPPQLWIAILTMKVKMKLPTYSTWSRCVVFGRARKHHSVCRALASPTSFGAFVQKPTNSLAPASGLRATATLRLPPDRYLFQSQAIPRWQAALFKKVRSEPSLSSLIIPLFLQPKFCHRPGLARGCCWSFVCARQATSWHSKNRRRNSALVQITAIARRVGDAHARNGRCRARVALDLAGDGETAAWTAEWTSAWP